MPLNLDYFGFVAVPVVTFLIESVVEGGKIRIKDKLTPRLCYVANVIYFEPQQLAFVCMEGHYESLPKIFKKIGSVAMP